MLTRKQHELLMFIHKKLEDTGISPSFDEMKEALNLKSKSGIHRLITALVERGFIERRENRARALKVSKLPETAVPRPNGIFAPNVIHGRFPLGNAASAPPTETVSLPLYGKIAAGTPIEALRDHSNALNVPADMLGTGEHYALTIEGDSMIDAGIQDGDTVIVRRCDTAENGTIVVALIDEHEATLKRLRRRGNSVALEPANTAYETRIFNPDRVRIQGRLVGLMRRYN